MANYDTSVLDSGSPMAGVLDEPRDADSTDEDRYGYIFAAFPVESITLRTYGYGSVFDKKQQFRDYFQQWKDQTGGMSSLTDITGNENYLNIISLGEDVVPDILKELQKEPLPLFLALRVLTKEKNVGADHSGDFRAIAREWIKWGKNNKKL